MSQPTIKEPAWLAAVGTCPEDLVYVTGATKAAAVSGAVAGYRSVRSPEDVQTDDEDLDVSAYLHAEWRWRDNQPYILDFEEHHRVRLPLVEVTPTPAWRPVYQTRFGDPAGNCTEASLASILDVDLGSVPDLWKLAGSPTEAGERLVDGVPCWRGTLDAWLAWRGLALVEVHWGDDAAPPWWAPDGLVVLAHGPAQANGLSHQILAKVVWDGRDADGHCESFHLEPVHDPHEGWFGLSEIKGISLLVRRVMA